MLFLALYSARRVEYNMWEIEISKLLYNPDSVFAAVLEAIGEAPALIPFAYTLVIICGILFNKKGFKDKKRELIGFSIYLMSVFIVTAVAVGALKHISGRARFYELSAPDYLGYTPFYVISDRGGSSFPSGHAAMSALSLLLVDVNDKHKIFKNNRLLWAFAIVFTFIVALSRLIAGAHYLTDLIFGAAIALAARYLLRLVYLKCSAKSRRDL